MADDTFEMTDDSRDYEEGLGGLDLDMDPLDLDQFMKKMDMKDLEVDSEPDWFAKKAEADNDIAKITETWKAGKELIERQHEILRKTEERAKREAVSHTPPGIKAFVNKPFRYFTFKDLDLVRDFEYELRSQERGFMSEDKLAEMLRDPVRFVLLLSPETTSCLIKDAQDFGAICNYLLYSLMGFCRPLVGEEKREVEGGQPPPPPSRRGRLLRKNHYKLYKRALFDLLWNYGFDTWKIDLSHILVAFLNFGVSENLICNRRFYQEALKLARERRKEGKPFSLVAHKAQFPVFFKKVYGAGGKDGGNQAKTPSKETIDKYFEAMGKQDVDDDDYDDDDDEEEEEEEKAEELDSFERLRESSMEEFFDLLADLCMSFAENRIMSRLFGRPFYRSEQNALVLYHVVSSVCLDRNLVSNPMIQNSCMRISQVILDSFDTRQWNGEGGSAEEPPKWPLIGDLRRVMFASSKLIHDHPEFWTWTSDRLPVDFEGDHHHNLVERVRMLPMTYRGRQLKKAAALMWLKQLAKPKCIAASLGEEEKKIGKSKEWKGLLTTDFGMAAEFLVEERRAVELIHNAYTFLSLMLLTDQVISQDPLVIHGQKETEDGGNGGNGNDNAAGNGEALKEQIKQVDGILKDIKRRSMKRNWSEDEGSSPYQNFDKIRPLLDQFPMKWNLMIDDTSMDDQI